ncbi:MAG: hypothetical protein ACLGGX_07315 [Bdellovibrionia bacterium]
MNKFSVSGEDLRNFYDSETILSTVFCDIERELQQDNQVVCQYILNGLKLSEKDEQKFSTLPLSQVQSLEYLAENSNYLTEKVTISWLEALPELIKQAEALALQLREPGKQSPLKNIHTLMENTEYLIGSVATLKTVLGDRIVSGIPSWAKAEALSLQVVREALVALDQKDFVLLADILEYDLVNCLTEWSNALVGIGKGLGIDFTFNTAAGEEQKLSATSAAVGSRLSKGH